MTFTEGLHATRLAKTTYRVWLKRITTKGDLVHREDGNYAIQPWGSTWAPLLPFGLALLYLARFETWTIIMALIFFSVGIFAWLFPTWGYAPPVLGGDSKIAAP